MARRVRSLPEAFHNAHTCPRCVPALQLNLDAIYLLLILSKDAFRQSVRGRRNFPLPASDFHVSAVGLSRQFPQVKSVSLYRL